MRTVVLRVVVLWAVCAVGSFAACSSTADDSCSSSSCPQGCCTSNDQCSVGRSHAACGTAGNACQACGSGETCAEGACVVVSITDGGTDSGEDAGGDAGTDGGTDAGTAVVNGLRTRYYLTEPGIESVPADFSAEPLTAWVESGGGYTSVTPTIRSRGVFELRIPIDSTYAIQLQENFTWFISSETSIDLGQIILGRTGVADLTTGPSSATVTLSGLAPWGANDQLILVSTDTGEIAELFGSPTAGSTSLNQETFAYSSLGSGREIDPGAGDSAVLVQRSAYASAAGGGIVVSRSVVLTNATVADGAPLQISGSFSPVTKKSITLDAQLADFAALTTQVHPQAQSASVSIWITAIPFTRVTGMVGYLGELGTFDAATPSNGTFVVEYGNPVPSQWLEGVAVTSVSFVSYQLPGTVSGTTVSALTTQDRPFPLAAGAVLAPRLSPPRDLLFEGQDGSQNVTLSTTTPRLSWATPTVGTPTGYAIRITELVVDGSSRTRRGRVGRVITTRNSVRIPPGLLESGGRYVFSVAAIRDFDGPRDQATRPFYPGLDWDTSAVLSGIVSVQ